MKLLTLRLENFQGIRDLVFEPHGKNADVFGDNGTGKTTLFNAFTWLLYDKDSLGRTAFEIKTLDASNEPLHGLDHCVEGVFSVNGRALTLRKEYKEVWTKKKGSAKETFTGHTTDHFIDGVPTTKGDYTAKIGEIADESVFKLLTNPMHFNTMLKWSERRELLLEVCGDVPDKDVYASDKRLAKLPKILGDRTAEQHKDVIRARMSTINKELDRIPVRIDEATRALPDIEGLVSAELTAELASVRKAKAEAEAELTRVKSGGETAEKTKTLREIEAAILQADFARNSAHNKALNEKNAELRKLQEILTGHESQAQAAQKRMKLVITEITEIMGHNEELRQRWHDENAKELAFEQSDTCPTCGQAIPAEQLEDARAKALADFNRKKADKLAEINETGKLNSATIVAYEAELAELKNRAGVPSEHEEAVKALQAEIAVMKLPEPTREHQALIKRKEALAAEIEQLATNDAPIKAALQNTIDELQASIDALEADQQRLVLRASGEKRIEELSAQERKLAAEYERLQEEQFLLDEFTRAKVGLLEERINSKFKLTKFKLFDVQVNGGIAECCVAMHNGVPYDSGLNRGMQINVGLDIINVLAEHYGFAPPVFADNAESVVDLLPITSQVIRLVVSGSDKKLRIKYQTAAAKNGLFAEAVPV